MNKKQSHQAIRNWLYNTIMVEGKKPNDSFLVRGSGMRTQTMRGWLRNKSYCQQAKS